jgi:hypothetical protein
MNFTRCKVVNDIAFVNFTIDEKVPFIRVSNIYCSKPEVNGNQLVFCISEDSCPELYRRTLEMEQQLAESIPKLPYEIWTEIPQDVQRALGDNEVAKHIRPNYYSNADQSSPKIFLKGTLKNLKIYRDDQLVTANDLDDGYYDFIISADTLYCGPHKEVVHKANLMLRIVQLNFHPVKNSSPRKRPWQEIATPVIPDTLPTDNILNQCADPVVKPPRKRIAKKNANKMKRSVSDTVTTSLFGDVSDIIEV